MRGLATCNVHHDGVITASVEQPKRRRLVAGMKERRKEYALGVA